MRGKRDDNNLEVGEYDENSDTITIEGTRYSGHVFRELGFPGMIGQVLRIDKKESGTVTATRLSKVMVGGEVFYR
jgi:hypothetical protein